MILSFKKNIKTLTVLIVRNVTLVMNFIIFLYVITLFFKLLFFYKRPNIIKFKELFYVNNVKICSVLFLYR